MVFLSFGVFMTPLHEAFEWDRSLMSLALSVSTLTLAVASPVAGHLLDRWGPRPVLLTSLVLMALSIMSLYYLTGTLWHLLGVYALIGVLGAGANHMPYARIIVSWFDRRRGLALGISMAALGLGGLVSRFVAANVLAVYGWRAAYLGLGLMVLLVAWPVAFLLLRDNPEQRSPDRAASASVPGLSWNETVRTPEFRMLMLVFFLIAATLHGLHVYLPSVLAARGLPREEALIGVWGFEVFLVIGRIGSGFLFDHRFAPRVALVAFLGSLLGMSLIGAVSTLPLAVLCAALLALGPGAETAMFGYFVSRYFGLKAFGTIYGWIFGADMLGTALSIYLWRLNQEIAGSYQIAQWAAVAGIAVICVTLYRLRPFPQRFAGVD